MGGGEVGRVEAGWGGGQGGGGVGGAVLPAAGEEEAESRSFFGA